MSDSHAGFPWKNVIGYVLSIILTIIAFALVLNHVLTGGALLAAIILLAVLQIFVQLFFFMHITESDGPNYHSIALVLGFIFTFAVVAGSIWIMAFNAQVS